MISAEHRRCPRCGTPSLRPVRTGAGTNLVCAACHRCWTQEYGYLIEVNRYACPGCENPTLCRPF